MQASNDYIEELFARKLGDMEAAPPDDGWIRIENELSRRSRMTRRFWMAAASFALLLSATATVVYMQNQIGTDGNATVAVVEKSAQQHEEQPSNIEQGNTDAPLEKNQPVAQQRENNNLQGETIASVTVAPSPVSVGSTVLQNDDNTGLQEATVPAHVQELAAVSEVREDANPQPNVSVYIDSWDELLRAQPVKELLSDKVARLKQEIPDKKADATVVAAVSRLPVYDDLAFMDFDDDSKKSQSRNRWEITGHFAPVYQSYRAISNVPGSLRKSDFDDAESPLMAYSGGITLAFKVFGRLSVQTGVLYAQSGQSINNVIPVTNMHATYSSTNPYPKNFLRTSSGSVTMASRLKSDANTTYSGFFNSEPETTNPTMLANASNSMKYKLIERIDYLEIPVMLRYRIIDRKMNFYVLGGMSANVLIDTNVFVDNGSEIVKGGTILMARPVNYSSTFGLGIGYQMMKNFSFGLEPSFKYYLQSYTTSSQIVSNPYAFGLFTSIFYQF